MNIKDVNLSYLSAEKVSKNLPENGMMPEDFSNTLSGQIVLLSEAKGKIELPKQLQYITMPQMTDSPDGVSDQLKYESDEQELAALIDKYLPLLSKKNEPVELNENVDIGATLLALTDPLQSITPESTPTMSATMTLNEVNFVKSLPGEAQLNTISKENVNLGNFLQNETDSGQSVQNEQGFNLHAIENSDSFEKTVLLEKKAPISSIEKMPPEVTVNMNLPHRPIDNRAESPVITKPLTHPGWSSDLGEQLVWINNKALSAAEIKLNPEHLGPLSVRIDVNKDQATIMFTAQHTDVREAIEASIPKLRELLATQQLNLVNVNISHNSMSDQGRSHAQHFFETSENHETGVESSIQSPEKIEHGQRVVSKGLLSLYA